MLHVCVFGTLRLFWNASSNHVTCRPVMVVVVVVVTTTTTTTTTTSVSKGCSLVQQ
jgi:uncharacterized membrane protein YdfJ with MMPL/SSD domain